MASPFVSVLFAGVAPREGSTAAVAEDAFAVRRDDSGEFWAAVADGASDGIFAERWAALLTEQWVSAGEIALPPLEPLRKQWRERALREPLPWHIAARAAQGAGAAFLGVAISQDGTWKALAAGDSVLIQLRGESVIAAFPIERFEDFPDFPLLLHTDPARSATTPQTASGKWEIGDELLLMTDALAAWFLREAAQSKNPQIWFVSIASVGTFGERLRQLKTSGRLRDDDATLVHLGFTE